MESASRQHAARRRHVERPAGRHLAVRAGPERRDRRDRHAARAVGGVRLRAAVRPGQEVRERRQRRAERAARRVAGRARSSATRRACRCTSARASATCRAQFRAGCIPAIINPDAVFAQDKGSFDPAQGPAVQQGRVRAGERVQLLLRAAATGSKRASAASATTTRTSRSSRTPGWRAAPTCSSASRCSTCGTGTCSSAGGGQFGEPGVQQRHCEPGLRQVEWRGDRPRASCSWRSGSSSRVASRVGMGAASPAGARRHFVSGAMGVAPRRIFLLLVLLLIAPAGCGQDLTSRSAPPTHARPA